MKSWAATAIDIQLQDRGAALRVCPVFAPSGPLEAARQFNLEFRVTDAAASPYFALGAVIFAGADGLRRGLALPPPATEVPALPHSLPQALDALEASEAASEWLSPVFLNAYLRHKRAEAEQVAALGPEELCPRYFEVY